MGSIEHPRSSNPYAFPLEAREYAPSPTPSLQEWQQLWKAWDLVTRDMIPAQNLHEKPIPLRNDLIFYLGHIPTFEDIHLTRALQADPTPPEFYQIIFERGIDPDVDNPDQCHDHSEIPDEWPQLHEILDYGQRVRQRITAIYKTGKDHERSVQRALWIGFEHECLHLDTFLYMTLQSSAVKPPQGVDPPDFTSIAVSAQRQRKENQWITIPEREIVLGIDPTDPEDETVGPERYYGWDNERPLRKVVVPSFESKARPVTNEEYALHLMHQPVGKQSIPAAWIEVPVYIIDNRIHLPSEQFTNFISDKAVRSVFGPVPLQYALDWPIMASFNELQSCVTWLGGTIPSIEQIRSIQTQVEVEQRRGEAITASRQDISKPDPRDIFVDMTSQNVGFNFFHPTPVTQNGATLSSPLGGVGGAWEQTSTLLESWDGFVPMKIYEGYTADFMDGKHYIVVGGSWATHPRITGRKSFLNWWQLNYIYPWVTARVVRSRSS